MLIIPARSDLPDQEMSISLDGLTFVLRFRWSAREGCQYFDVLDAQGVPIYMGIKVVLRLPLGDRCTDPRRPPGTFIAFDTSGKGLPPGLNDLGDRVELYYIEAVATS